MKLTQLSKIDQKQFLEELKEYTISYQDTIGIDNKQTFGVEIEFVGPKHNDIEKLLTKEMEEHWTFKSESSLNEDFSLFTNINGGEMTSNILKDNPESWKELKSMCEFLIHNGAVINCRCAGHIHIGSQVLKNYKSFKNFLKLWLIFEDVIYRFGYGEEFTGRRYIEKYAYPIAQKINQCMDKYHKLRMKNMDDLFQFYKKYAIGLVRFQKPGKYRKNNTIEFRCPNGTLNPMIWQNNIRFFFQLLLRCNHKGNWDIINQYLRNGEISNGNIASYDQLCLEKAMTLCDFVFDKEIDQKNFLKQYIKDDKTKKIIR